MPLSAGPEPAVPAVGQDLVGSISPATVARRLAGDAIKPWQHRSWIFPGDPDSGPPAPWAPMPGPGREDWTCPPGK